MKKFKFYMVWVIFVLPVVMSIFLYYFQAHFHFHTVNRGHLVTPPIKVNYLTNAEKKKWQIIYIFENQCGEHCQQVSHQLFQLQKALGKDYKRVRVNVISSNTNQTITLQNDFISKKKNNFIVKNKIYLIDPLGFLFMYYSSDVNAMDILKDLKKVLGASQIG